MFFKVREVFSKASAIPLLVIKPLKGFVISASSPTIRNFCPGSMSIVLKLPAPKTLAASVLLLTNIGVLPFLIRSSFLLTKSWKNSFLLTIKESLLIPPRIVCIGFCVLPNRSSNTFRSACDKSAKETMLLLAAWSADVFDTKKSGTLKRGSEGLVMLNPAGNLTFFNKSLT